jgi:hypothetical protein
VQGFRYNITANHSRSLATSTRIPDLTDGIHTVRIKYTPNFDEKEVPHPSFQVSGFTTWFMNVSVCVSEQICSNMFFFNPFYLLCHFLDVSYRMLILQMVERVIGASVSDFYTCSSTICTLP